MEIPKSRRQILIATAIAGFAGCSGNSGDNEQGDSTGSRTTEEATQETTRETTKNTQSTVNSTPEPIQYERRWTELERVTRIDTYDDNLYARSSDSTLYSLDVQTGTPNWTTESVGDFVDVTDSYIVTPNSVRKRTDGSVQWQGADRFDTEFKIISVIDNAVYAITSKSSEDKRQLTKFSIEDGSVEWQTSYGYSIVGSNFGLHLLQPNDINTRNLVTKDSSTGENIYSKEIQSNDISLIDTSGNSLIAVRFDDQSAFFFALDAESGDELWETKINDGFPLLGSRGRKSHIFSENYIYFPTWDRENNKFTVQSYNLSNGELRWKQNISLSVVEFALGMAKSGDTIFFGKLGQGGTKLVLLNSNSGEILSTNPIKILPLTVIENNLLGLDAGGDNNSYRLVMSEPVSD